MTSNESPDKTSGEESPKLGADTEFWLKHGEYKLTNFDRKVLASPREWLEDNHINASQFLLKKQFPDMKGLQDVLLNKTEELSGIDENEKFVQIIHESDDHWVVLSNCKVDSNQRNSRCILYDSRLSSFNSTHSPDVYRAMFSLMKAESIILDVKSVSQQPDTNQCGLYAIAFAQALCAGEDPSAILFTDSGPLLRSHLKTCFENGEITRFPTGSQTIIHTFVIK